MNERDKDIMIKVLAQVEKIDFKILARQLNPDVEEDQITRAMVEGTRIRWKGLKQRLGITAPPQDPPNTPPQRAAPRRGGGVSRSGNGKGGGRKRKIQAENTSDFVEAASPSKKKEKGQAVVKTERSNQEDKAFEDTYWGLDICGNDEA